MKKILIFLTFMLSLSLSTYSQDYVRIGRERSEILKEFKGYNPTIITEKGFNIIKVIIKGNEIIYLFDELNYCDHTTVITKDFNTAIQFEKFYVLKYYSFGKNEDWLNQIDYTIFLNNDKKYVFVFRRLIEL